MKLVGIQRLKHDANPQSAHHAEKRSTCVNKQTQYHHKMTVRHKGRGNSIEKGKGKDMRKDLGREVSQVLKNK